MEDHKGFEFVLRALEELRHRRSPALGALRVVVTGAGGAAETVAAECRHAGLEPHFDFKGWLARDEFERLWEATDVFLFTSLRETTGVVLIEAMMRGVAPVVICNGGPADIVADGCGIKVPCGSLDGMVMGIADALEKLHASAQLRAELGSNARRHALTTFDWDDVVGRMLEFYEEVCSRSR